MKILKKIILPMLLSVICGCEKGAVNPVPSDAIIVEAVEVSDIRAEDVPALFASNKIRYNTVSVLNWMDKYPYLPQVDFAVAHNGENLIVHYRVTEKRTIGTIEKDLDGVYKDSCCEIFFKQEGDSLYYNVESNCIGTVTMECGAGRSGREASTGGNLEAVGRWASLGRKAVGTINRETHWELALVIPVSVLWKHNYGTLSGRSFQANVYNCVGSGDDRQYVTWHPVNTPAPDFHRPEFFRRIYFR